MENEQEKIELKVNYKTIKEKITYGLFVVLFLLAIGNMAIDLSHDLRATNAPCNICIEKYPALKTCIDPLDNGGQIQSLDYNLKKEN